ncbi:MAG: hypothetical protein QOE96_1845, partial [Blastocatellia bacterium]|nr:hypothetical protein [Blastocatellia bacterium]
SAPRAYIEQRLTLRVFADKVYIVLDLLVDRWIETVIIEFQVAAPTVEVLGIIIKRDRFRGCRDRRDDIFTMIAFVDLLSGKVRANAPQSAIA